MLGFPKPTTSKPVDCSEAVSSQTARALLLAESAADPVWSDVNPDFRHIYIWTTNLGQVQPSAVLLHWAPFSWNLKLESKID